jgi:hypothetical protein
LDVLFPRNALGAVFTGLTLFVAIPAQAQNPKPLPEICQRGALAEPVPFEHVLYLEMLDYFAIHADRVDYEAFAPKDQSDHEAVYEASTLAQAIEWPGVLADRAAELPESAHDLPWLILLAYSQTDNLDPIWALTRGPESILSPDLPPLMERHGLTVEAELLRKAMALFPDWGLNPADRAGLVVAYNGGKVNEPLSAALETLGAHWPLQPNGAAEAAMRLIRAEPALLAGFEARLAALSDAERLDIQVGRLWTACMADWWTPEEADASLALLGSAQAGLLLLDMLSFMVDGTSLHPWFEDNGAGQTAVIAGLLERRGEAELAAALREGMALFPQPFARDSETRWTQLELMDEATIARIDRLMPEDGYDRIRAVMMGLAKDSGLLPR